MEDNAGVHIIDVRPRTEFGICRLPRSINVPLNELVGNPAAYLPERDTTETYVFCRLGNDSQIAADALREVCRAAGSGHVVKDVIGGLRAWAKDVDAGFPVY